MIVVTNFASGAPPPLGASTDDGASSIRRMAVIPKGGHGLLRRSPR
jgi:hypothetical protein